MVNAEDPSLATTIEEYVRDLRQQFLHRLTPEEQQAVLDQLPPEDVFKHFTPEDVFKRFTPEERLRGLKPEDVLQRFAPEERLRGLDPEQIKAYLKKFEH